MSAPLPGWIVWLLSRRLSDAWREVVLGDLAEEYEARSAAAPAAARRWLWWQAVRCLVSPPPNRTPAALPSLPLEKHPMLQTLAADVRYAVRVLGRAPSFTLAVVAVLALGIGATTAIFSIVNTVLLRPLPFDDADRLVRLFHVPPQATFPGIPRFALSPANFYDWQREATAFEGMALYRGRSFTLTGSGAPRSINVATVGAGFFDILRVRPAQGRLFRPDEDAPGARVVVISDGFWRTQMGGASVIGRSLTLDGEGYTIVGVMPASASLASWPPMARNLWVPLALTAENRAVRENHNLAAVARLKPGIRADEARSQLEVIARRLEQAYPEANAGWGATLMSLQDDIVGDIGSTLVMLLAAVGLVLLIACANVGNLLFTRALGRRKEVAIRAALGAGRRRVLQQLLVESLVLGLAGGAAGLLFAEGALRAGAALLADQVPRADEIAVDGTVLLFVLGASILTGILAGVVPALRVGAHAADRGVEGGRPRRRGDRPPDAAAARRGRGRAVRRAADGRGGDGPQPHRDPDDRRRLRAGGRADDGRQPAPGALSHRRPAQPVLRRCPRADADAAWRDRRRLDRRRAADRRVRAADRPRRTAGAAAARPADRAGAHLVPRLRQGDADPDPARPRLRRQRRRLAAGEPQRREAAVGRRGSGGQARHPAAGLEDAAAHGGRHRRRRQAGRPAGDAAGDRSTPTRASARRGA